MPILMESLYFTISEELDVIVMCHSGHLRRGDTTATIQCGEHLAEGDHLTPNAGFLFHQSHLISLVSEVKRRLHTRDSTTNNHGINSNCIGRH
jgi:hypothetical protein